MMFYPIYFLIQKKLLATWCATLAQAKKEMCIHMFTLLNKSRPHLFHNVNAGICFIYTCRSSKHFSGCLRSWGGERENTVEIRDQVTPISKASKQTIVTIIFLYPLHLAYLPWIWLFYVAILILVDRPIHPFIQPFWKLLIVKCWLLCTGELLEGLCPHGFDPCLANFASLHETQSLCVTVAKSFIHHNKVRKCWVFVLWTPTLFIMNPHYA